MSTTEQDVIAGWGGVEAWNDGTKTLLTLYLDQRAALKRLEAQLRDVTAERDRLLALCKRSIAHLALEAGTGRLVHPEPTRRLYRDLADAIGIKPARAALTATEGSA